MKRTLRSSTLTPLVIPENINLGDATPLPPPQKPAPKRVRWGTLREECEKAMDSIHDSKTHDYTAMRLVAEVLLHVADGTEGSAAAQQSVHTMREALRSSMALNRSDSAS